MSQEPNQTTEPEQPNQTNSKSERRLPPGWKAAKVSSEDETGTKEGSNRYLFVSENTLESTQKLFPLLGYGLFLYVIVDTLYIIIPPRLTDPVWQFQLMGRLVEYVWFPLFGFIFVFYRRQGYIKKLEIKLLKFLSWVCLLVGLIYLLMIPLGINNTRRIYETNRTQFNAQIAQANERIKTLEESFERANTPQDLRNLLAQLSPQGVAPPISDLEGIKQQLTQSLGQSGQNFRTQLEAQKKAQDELLLKNSLKWNLGALISGTWFILIWSQTSWIRRLGKSETP
jgi:hypothetical protein